MKNQQAITAKRGESPPRFSFAIPKARRALLAWFGKNPASHPWRLDFKRTGDPYVVWVSEIMLQQTVIKAVLPVYDRFLQRFPTLGSLAKSTSDDVRSAVRGLGYYRRFHFLHQAAKKLAGDNGRKHIKWPIDFEGWKELPGVGDYTAAAVSSIAFDYPAAAVDGNVERIIARLLAITDPIVAGPVKKKIKQAAQTLLDCEQPGRFNEAMMELGQTICRPLNPKCAECVFQNGCLARNKNLISTIPALKPAIAFTDVTLNLYVLRHAGRIFVAKRPDTAKFLKRTDGFATEIVTGGERRLDGSFEGTTFAMPNLREIGEVKHGITTHRIRAKVLFGDLKNSPVDGQWVPVNEVEPRLVSNLDRKAWRLVEKKTLKEATTK